MTALELFHEQVRARPDAIAVCCDGESVSYGELHRRVLGMAAALRADGIDAESRVGVEMSRSVDLVVSLLAVMAAGAVYVPLAPEYPRPRLGLIAADAGLAATVTAVLTGPAEPVTDVEPDQGAYLIYTSGSTGRPKGVLVPHRGLRTFTSGVIEVLGIRPGDRVLQFAALGFDAAISEYFMALAGGATLVLARCTTNPVGAELTSLLHAEGITVLTAPPAVLAVTEPYRRLRTVVSAGENCPWPVAMKWRDGRQFVNGYGPTEATVGVTYHELGHADEGAVPIGRAIPDTALYVLDEDLHQVQPGGTGEMYIGGAGLARGYVGRPGLTADRFVPSPFDPGRRLYRTGDLARISPAGQVFCVGRTDSQVKIRGHRVELGEVEALLRQCSGVVDAAAAVDFGERLLGYVVGDVDSAVVRRHLRREVPQYLVPSVITVVPELPLTPNGKVDRSALPRPQAGEYAEPLTEAERFVASAMADVLGVERIGRTESFFDHGGHSLGVARVLARLKAQYDVTLPTTAVFDHPTAAGLAPLLPDLPAPRASVPRTRSVQLSRAQQRIWFMHQMAPGSPRYHVASALRLRGPLDVRRLEQSVAATVRGHDALALVFDGDTPRLQPFEPAFGSAVPLDEFVRRPFDLERGPLLRVQLTRLGQDDHVLAVAMHHLVCDGWSASLLFEEIAARYRGDEGTLPAQAATYLDYVHWEQQSEFDGLHEFWADALRGTPPLVDLPLDRPRPARQAFRGALREFTVPEVILRRVREVAAEGVATPFMVVLAALHVLLFRYTGQRRIPVGVPVANRPGPQFEQVVGCFVNTVAVAVDVSADLIFRAVVGRVKQASMAAFDHAGLPFEEVVAALNPDRDLSHTPAFQVALAYQNAGTVNLDIPGLSVERIEPDTGATPFDLTLSAEERDNGLACTLRYDTDLFDPATANRFSHHFVELLAAAVSEPDTAVRTLPLAHYVSNDNHDNGYPQRSIVDLLVDQISSRPDAIALSSGDFALSYRDLGRCVARRAWWLRELGVGEEAPVGVLADRSVDMIIAALAVLAAGGVYVPLDPGYPDSRLAQLVEDAGAGVVALLADSVHADHAPVPAVSLDADVSDFPDDLPLTPIDPDRLAYIMFTSGSAGTPKGVAVTHGNVVHLVKDNGFFDPDPSGVFLHAASPSFDGSTFEIFACLLNGARLEVLPAGLPSLAELSAVVKRSGTTTAFFTTGLFHQLAPSLRGLRHVVVGGDVLNASACRQSRSTVTNGYGPTESTVFATTHRVSVEDDSVVPVGRPVAHVRVFVVDDAFQRVPVGVVGEVMIGGAGLARGYHGCPGRTADRFVPSPFNPGERLYRTGDLAKVLADGAIVFVGRRDDQVKVRGFRVEPGEVAAALRRHPAVRDAVVLTEADRDGARLVGYVETTADVADIQSWLWGVLPAFMLPASLLALPVFPLNANGKVDRSALPRERQAKPVGHVSPRDDVESVVAVVIAEVLGLHRVGVFDDFFALGGHSLDAMRVLGRLRVEFGVDLPMSVLFEQPTVAGLSESITYRQALDADPAELERLLAQLEEGPHSE